MKNTKSGFLFFLFFLMLQSCRFDTAKNQEINPVDGQNKEATKLTLSQMETLNGALIDSVEKRVLKQIKQRNFVQLYAEADTSLTKKINAGDIQAYFKMIDDFYGRQDTLKTYGTVTTADYKTLDYIANFSSGDSLELNCVLKLYRHNVKLSYITFNRFKNNPIPNRILKIISPQINNVFKKNFQLVYEDCTKKFKSNITLEQISTLIEKHLKNNDSVYELLDCKPLIFGKGEVGFMAKTKKVLKDGTTKKINIVFFLDEYGAYKIADIQINK